MKHFDGVVSRHTQYHLCLHLDGGGVLGESVGKS